jgi:hypothetical protein
MPSSGARGSYQQRTGNTERGAIVTDGRDTQARRVWDISGDRGLTKWYSRVVTVRRTGPGAWQVVEEAHNAA